MIINSIIIKREYKTIFSNTITTIRSPFNWIISSKNFITIFYFNNCYSTRFIITISMKFFFCKSITRSTK
ncbi:hypothetical protein C1646_729891 [Rhizophagus diaphanus]|nr:hypothetical protein C1646_729891 [Rhizophagus diaphanus] [Rhizophagus sp. MUCL 43196]